MEAATQCADKDIPTMHASCIHDPTMQVNSFLIDFNFNISKNVILPKCSISMLLRFTQEATLPGYMKVTEGYAKDTKIAA
jgi:hypothetical protein